MAQNFERNLEKRPLLQAEEEERFKFAAPYFTRMSIAEPSSSSASSSRENGASGRGTGGLFQGSIMLDFGRGRIVMFRTLTANVLLTVIVVIAGIGSMVVLPILTSSLANHVECGRRRQLGGFYVTQLFVSVWLAVIFAVLVFLARLLNPHLLLSCPLSIPARIVLGFLAMSSSLLMMYASAPGRAPYILQGLSTLAIIPFTLAVERIAYRKAISMKRLLCTAVIVAGLLLSLSPVVFKSAEFHNGTTASSKVERILWMLAFVLAQLPFSILTVVIESMLKLNRYEDVSSLALMMWVQTFFLVSQVFFFFTDLIPQFDNTSSITGFGKNLKEGLQCFLGSAPSPGNCSLVLGNTSMLVHPLNPDPHCTLPITRVWLFIILYGVHQYFSLLLMKYNDGAVFLALVSSLAGPCASAFWFFFNIDQQAHIHWHPAFPISSLYILIGLIITVPAVVVYRWITFKESPQNPELSRYRLEL